MNRRGYLGVIIGSLTIIVVGFMMYPTIKQASTATIATKNVTGASSEMLSFVPSFFVFAIIIGALVTLLPLILPSIQEKLEEEDEKEDDEEESLDKESPYYNNIDRGHAKGAVLVPTAPYKNQIQNEKDLLKTKYD